MRRMNRKGFTLVELLVVLAILGLLAGIGIPQYMATLERSREAADNALIAMVQSAVDGYLAETGLEAGDTGTDIIALKGASDVLEVTAKGKSILTSLSIDFKGFLENATLPDQSAFKSNKYGKAPDFKWLITAQGKVSIKTTAETP